MSFFKDLMDRVLSRPGGGTATATPGQAGLMEAVAAMVQGGGLNNLLDQFRQKGLADAVQSWIGTGANQPVSGNDVQDALGQEKIDSIAEQTGLPKEKAAAGLAQILPQLVDRLTPNGKLPEGGNLGGMLGSLLAGLGKRNSDAPGEGQPQ